MTGTNTYTATDLVAVIPEVWLPVVLEAWYDKTVAANFFLDLTDMASGTQGDIFHLADIFTNRLTSAAKTNGSEVTLVSPATTDVTITATTWRHIAYLVEDNELQQTAQQFAIFQRLAEQAGDVLADDLEDNLLALWSSIGSGNTVGSTGSAVTDLQVRQSIRLLDTATNPVPKANRGWFFHPRVFWDQVSGIQKFYDASQAGWYAHAPQGLVPTGNFGPFNRERGLYGVLYGDPVFVTNNIVTNLTAYRQIYAHRDAIAFLTRTPGGERVRMQSKYVLENLGILTVADIIYGSAMVRASAAVLLNGSTTATTA